MPLLESIRAYAQARGLSLRVAYRQLVAVGLQVTAARTKGADVTNGKLDAYTRRQNAQRAAQIRWTSTRKRPTTD